MTDAPSAVLFDFSGTLFRVESAHDAVLAALGPSFVHLAPELVRWSAINGSDTPAELPAHLAAVWAQRDLSAVAHRAAYSGLSMHAGLSADQAHALYERGLTPEARPPFPDTVEALARLHELKVPVALVSNIGWDPRPVLRAYGVERFFDALVLSDECGVVKPDPEIFRLACAALDTDPSDTLMIGDNAGADGGATAIGCRFALVSADWDRHPNTLLQAIGC